MKRCYKCDESKELSEFGVNRAKSDGLQRECRACRSTYAKRWYSENREVQGARVRSNEKAAKRRAQQVLWDYKLTHPCACGEADPVVLQFDHRDPTVKILAISEMLAKGNRLASIMAEIEKCDVRCANCHLKRTATQFSWWKPVVAE